eukprot:Hpha_TRINITY_DN15669_c3_g1::TRINITY_DN15669_c3_g1_i12::g.99848::m.99848
MGKVRKCCTGCISLVVLLIAITPIVLPAVAPYLLDRGPIFGLTPAQHRGKKWGFTFEEMPDLTGKVALVTGANSGLGYWTALHLARKGAVTVITCRTEKKCQKAAAEIKANHTAAVVEPMILDLNSLKSVREFAAAYLAKHKRTDTFVMNAGMVSPEYQETLDGIEVHMGVNHVAHQLLGDLLEHTLVEKSTVVVVASASHYSAKAMPLTLEGHNVDDGTDKYATSKLANVYYAQELAERLASKGVRVNSCHPGLVMTNIFEPIKDQVRATPVVGNILEGLLQRWVIEGMSWDSETGALTQLFLAVAPAVVEGGITGKWYHPVAREHTPSDLSYDKKLQKQLWDFTEAIIKLKSPA